MTPKLVDYGLCRRCGRCVLGCPVGAKWDSRRVLTQAIATGADLVTRSKVESVVVEPRAGGAPNRRRVSGVFVRRAGAREFLAADLVVLAAGGLGTPAILEASGIRTESRLFVDPVLCVAAPWPEAQANQEIPMPFVVDRGAYIVSPYFDYLSFFFNRAWLKPGGQILSLGQRAAFTSVSPYQCWPHIHRRCVRRGISVLHLLQFFRLYRHRDRHRPLSAHQTP